MAKSKEPFDMYDLEQNILKCWNLVDEVEELANNLHDGEINEDQAITTLYALSTSYRIRFEKLFSKYEQGCKEWLASDWKPFEGMKPTDFVKKGDVNNYDSPYVPTGLESPKELNEIMKQQKKGKK